MNHQTQKHRSSALKTTKTYSDVTSIDNHNILDQFLCFQCLKFHVLRLFSAVPLQFA